MRPALRVLRQEHDALSALLHTLVLMVAQARETHRPPDFGALRAMLFYVDEFPEKRHHRKESELLFPRLRARTPLARELLDRLDEDHARGHARIRDIEHALTEYEMLGPAHAADFERALRRYVDFYRAHMALEEDEILPLAESCLTDEDWVHLDAELAGEPDPLTGRSADAEYEALFDRILSLVPAPFGLGAPAGQA
ncbi:MAG TPA: hemerythrin domain-containing protein [Burkholderiaceae bacterium]